MIVLWSNNARIILRFSQQFLLGHQYYSSRTNWVSHYYSLFEQDLQMRRSEANLVVFLLLLQGRNGLGNIYVWASGDGGEDDDCNCDGYAASMWTISINSAINDGQNAHYDESCSSTLASTFSNGAKDPNTGVVSNK